MLSGEEEGLINKLIMKTELNQRVNYVTTNLCQEWSRFTSTKDFKEMAKFHHHVQERQCGVRMQERD